MKVLQTKHLSKHYGSLAAVNNITMDINEGDIYGFIGENGAGKTTFIRLVSGLIKKSAGEFTLFEGSKDYHIAAVVEAPAMYLGMSAFDNMKMQAKITGVNDEERLKSLLILVGLDYVIGNKKKVKDFSLGMKQRLVIAMTLVSNPKFVMLDEPMNGLDPEGIIGMRNLILRLNKEEGITFLISSHILEELSRVATRYGFIHKGVLVHEVTREQINERLTKTTILKLSTDENVEELLKEYKDLEYKLADNTLTIKNNINVSDLIVTLSKSNITVLDVKTIEPSIEDYYLNVIGGNI